MEIFRMNIKEIRGNINYERLPKNCVFTIRLKYGGLKTILYQINEEGSFYNRVIMSSQAVAKHRFTSSELKSYKAQKLLPTPLYTNKENALVGEWYLHVEDF